MALDLIKAYALAAMLICTICTLVLSWSCLSTECERIPVAMDRHTSRDGRSLLGDATEHKKTLPRTFLLALVMSGPNETDARDVIRRTWILLNKKGAATFSYRFPIGTKGLDADVLHALAVENQRNGDLALIDNLADSYDNLARKTLASMQHAVKSFDFDFVLKSLRDIQHPMLYWGFLDGRAKPRRKGKWSEPDWMLCDRYLPYQSTAWLQLGGGYVLAAELVQFLASNARLLKMYKNEDVSVGAWLAGLNVKYVHDPRFDTEWTSRGCHNEYLITHKHTARQLHDFYDNLLQQRPLCNKEFRIRPSYVYNWAVPPSECCARINGSRIP